jgi:flagellar L-ring protein precursor FlgH
MKHTTLKAFVFGIAVLTSAGTTVADSIFNSDGFHAFATDHRAFRPGDSLTVIVTEIASATSTGLGNNFQGGGKTERTGKLLAKITVTVQSIDELGSLNIKGAQTIDVNNERQSIMMTGRVRPQDIESDNTVVSSRITDAHIEYIGDGVLNEQQRPGILTRLLSWLRIL